MIDGALVLWMLALVLAVSALRRSTAESRTAFTAAAERFIEIMPRIALALVTAGFLSVLVPAEPVARYIGPDSGLPGILVASVVGGFVPGGPILSFPLVVVLYKAGAGLPQLIAFLTAWSVFAFHRVLIYELTIMGWRFSAVRLLSSLVLPPLAGLLAMALSQVLAVR
ncbi:MAG TPA: permease [Beijerinckiaceae bacterium]|nr:permease [Beijerinckiaceae bacterium]